MTMTLLMPSWNWQCKCGCGCIVGRELHSSRAHATLVRRPEQQRPPSLLPPKGTCVILFYTRRFDAIFVLCHVTPYCHGNAAWSDMWYSCSRQLGPRHFLILFSRLFRIVNFDCYSTLYVCTFFVVCVLCACACFLFNAWFSGAWQCACAYGMCPGAWQSCLVWCHCDVIMTSSWRRGE